MRVPFSPHLRQCLLFVDLSMIAILTSVRHYLTVVLICISLMISGIEFLFMYIGHLYVCFGEVSIQSFAHFLVGGCFLGGGAVGVEFCKFYKFWILTSHQMYRWVCSPNSVVVFLFCGWFPLLCKNILVWCSSIYLFFLLSPLPGEIYLIKYCYEQCLRFCCLCFLLWFLWFQVYHWSIWYILNLFLCVV